MNFKLLAYQFLPGFLIRILKKYHYLRKLKKTSESDEEDLALLKYFIKEGDHVFDIGANYGMYTKFMSQHCGKTGKVLSFEPIPETFGYLSFNISRLKLENTISLKTAVSNKNGIVKMEVPKFSNSGDNFYEAHIVDSANNKLKTFQVNTCTLDEISEENNVAPAFIKCDVEGHELYVFKGAARLLSNVKPALLIEINNSLTNADPDTGELINMLKSSGYAAYINENRKLKKWNGEKKVNYYFLTEQHIKKLEIVEK